MELVVLVDKEDKELDVMEKIQAHKVGALHRAFSVFIFNDKGELMLQKRAMGKYHSEGLWTNTCCSHPKPGEKTMDAAKRRLKEEMGFVCDLDHVHRFIYRAEMANGLIEHEYDHVFFGTYNADPSINTNEVEEWKFVSLQEIDIDLQNNPKNYTEWFKIVFDEIKTLKQ